MPANRTMPDFPVHAAKRGFTLIELSIVLMIIGLIVGGILVGSEMIKAAGLRRIIGQIESYNLAVQVFRDKYNTHPGDGLDVSSFLAGAIDGNKNDKLECNDTGNPAADTGLGSCLFDLEYAQFWVHLSQAGLIEGSYNGSNIAGQGFPTTRDYGGIIAYYDVSAISHRFAIGARQTLLGTLGSTVNGVAPTFSHTDAGAIDRKWDDGLPNDGNISAYGSVTVCQPPPHQFNCITTNTTPSSYNIQATTLLRLYFKMTGW